MRKTKEQLLNEHPCWNSEKHDIEKVMYGDVPLFMFNKKEYEHKHTDSLFGVECYVYANYGDYNVYRTLKGEIYAKADTGDILCGDFNIKYRGKTHNIILNRMYGLNSLTILRLGNGNGVVKGWCNKDGQGSPANHLNTEEMDYEEVKTVLNREAEIKDFGEIVKQFFDLANEVFEDDTTNYIMKKTFELYK